MTLLELTEPLFQYLCRLNRVARKSGIAPTGETTFVTKAGGAPRRGLSLDYAVVRNEIKGLFEDMQQKAEKDFRLKNQFEKMELPLIFFVDSSISESSLSFAAEWNQNRLAYERNELAGDDKFFELLNEDKNDRSDEGAERLAVYYVCLGLGFTGVYFQQPEFLRKTMLELAPRIKRWLDADEMAKLCPDAYENVDTRDLTEPPSRKVLVVALVFACLTIAALVFYMLLYYQNRGELTASFKEILKHEVPVARAK